jgi:ATP-dependent Clp protease adaptor protein ClpS
MLFPKLGGDKKDGNDAGDGSAVVDAPEAAAAEPKLKEPPRFAVILHNDDYTTMEFVIEILRRFFGKTEQEAMLVMLQVHHAGHGVAGVYSHQIAETKSTQVQEHARSRGFPLKCSVEEA